MRVEKLFAGMAALALAMGIVSCGFPFDAADSNNNSGGQGLSPQVNLERTVDDFSSNFAKAAFLTVRAVADSLELIESAGVDLEGIHSRAARSGNQQVMFSDLGPYVAGLSRGARSAAGTELSLEDELAQIAEDLGTEIALLIPDADAAIAAGLITIEDGDILWYGGTRMPVDSLEGIVAVEIMTRVAAGEDIEAAITDIQDELDRLMEIDEPQAQARGLYMRPNATTGGWVASGGRWTGGLVRYRFSNDDLPYTDDWRQIARAAMAEWQARTGGRVRFEEISPSAWDMITRSLGQSQFLTFRLTPGTNNATVGSVGALSTVRTSKDHPNPMRVYLHEIGHALGLMHEHQRPDRNSYVTIDPSYLRDKINYEVVPRQTLVAGLKAVRIWRFTIWLPYIWYLDFGYAVGAFDFDSVMIYSGAGVKRRTPVNGLYDIPYNTGLSNTDVETVRRMY